MHLIGDSLPGFVEMFPDRCYCNCLPISSGWLVCFHAKGCVELVESRDQQAIPWKAHWLELLQSVTAEQVFVVVGVGD